LTWSSNWRPGEWLCSCAVPASLGVTSRRVDALGSRAAAASGQSSLTSRDRDQLLLQLRRDYIVGIDQLRSAIRMCLGHDDNDIGALEAAMKATNEEHASEVEDLQAAIAALVGQTLGRGAA
jgi:hypothetical protein